MREQSAQVTSGSLQEIIDRSGEKRMRGGMRGSKQLEGQSERREEGERERKWKKQNYEGDNAFGSFSMVIVMACLSWSWLNWARDKASGMAWSNLDPAVGETRDLFATGDVIDQAEPSHQRQENSAKPANTARKSLGGLLTIGPAGLRTYEDDNSGEQGLSQAEAKIAASVMTRTYT
ncbi:hypothetical protein FDENT_1560 [Fusarium denticulatum]|uniref:Uncharacterized protein n=1 Tax=Fusarium denticulatum TaxID=48507 RepID=A0A8H5XIP1_9HYPO|nr:hypothetical protein FDENT_1560 [Fusarium denticulatum]